MPVKMIHTETRPSTDISWLPSAGADPVADNLGGTMVESSDGLSRTYTAVITNKSTWSSFLAASNDPAHIDWEQNHQKPHRISNGIIMIAYNLIDMDTNYEISDDEVMDLLS